jgi:hypothetical protein
MGSIEERIEARREAAERREDIAAAWDDALELGMEAAVLAQDAVSGGQWRRVADKWEEAIATLELVAEDDPNYAAAQEKIPEYQANRDVAVERWQAKVAEKEALDAQRAVNASSDVEASVAAIDAYLATQDPNKEIFLGADTLPDSDYELGIVVGPAWALIEDSNKEFFIGEFGRIWQEQRSPGDPGKAVLWVIQGEDIVGIYDSRGVTLRD